MSSFRKKINFLLVIGMCLFASAFGIGMNILISQPTSANISVTEEHDEEVSSTSVTTSGTRISVYNDYYINTAVDTGYSQLTDASWEDLGIASGDTLRLTNVLIEFSDASGFANLSGVNLYTEHSIFIYTGSATSNIALFSGIAASVSFSNSIFFATNGSAVNEPSGTTSSYSSFYYDSSEGITGYDPNGDEISGNIKLGSPTSGTDVGLAYRVGFYAQNTYAINSNSTTETELWNGTWNFSGSIIGENDDGWMFAVESVGSGTVQGSALYPYPRQYVLENVIDAGGYTVTLYAGYEQAEADTGKVVLGLSGANTITLSSNYALTRPGYSHSGWFVRPDNSTSSTSVQITEDTTLYADWDIETYTITYNLSGGTYNNSTSNVIRTYTYKDSPTLLTNIEVTRKGKSPNQRACMLGFGPRT